MRQRGRGGASSLPQPSELRVQRVFHVRQLRFPDGVLVVLVAAFVFVFVGVFKGALSFFPFRVRVFVVARHGRRVWACRDAAVMAKGDFGNRDMSWGRYLWPRTKLILILKTNII